MTIWVEEKGALRVGYFSVFVSSCQREFIMIKRVSFLVAVLLIGFCWSTMFCGTAQSATVYFDDFSGSIDDNLHGQAPDTRPGSETWSAYESWKADGTTVNSGNANANAWVPFTPANDKVYTLSADVNPPTTTKDTWQAIGFSQMVSPPLDGHFITVSSVAWMLNTEDDNSATAVQAFLGPNTANVGPSQNTVPAGPVELKVVLDTRPTAWTAEWYVNGSSLGGPTVFGTNPLIYSVGFAVSQTSTTGGTIDNFLLTENPGGPPVPGDANWDGIVDQTDAATLASHWQTLTGATWAMGDFNGDFAVNDIDATMLAANWTAGVATVPEPLAGIMLLPLLIAAVAVKLRHGRRRGPC